MPEIGTEARGSRSAGGALQREQQVGRSAADIEGGRIRAAENLAYPS
jgi:hypothetical protein